MKDSKGNELKVGDRIKTNLYGVCEITMIHMSPIHNEEFISGRGERGSFGYTASFFHSDMPEAVKVDNRKNITLKSLVRNEITYYVREARLTSNYLRDHKLAIRASNYLGEVLFEHITQEEYDALPEVELTPL